MNHKIQHFPKFTLTTAMTRRISENVDSNVVRIFVIRHGRTDFNSKKIMQGQTDIDINEEGLEQSRLVGQHFKDIGLDFVAMSDLLRCVNTSKEILRFHPKLDHTKIHTTQAFRERHMGEVEGMYMKDAVEKFGVHFDRIGEKREAMVERVEKEWDYLVKKAITDDYLNVVCCTHGGVITAFINHLHDKRGYSVANHLVKSDLKVPFNTSVTIVDIDRTTGNGIIQDFGVTEHLGGQYEVQNQMLR